MGILSASTQALRKIAQIEQKNIEEENRKILMSYIFLQNEILK